MFDAQCLLLLLSFSCWFYYCLLFVCVCVWFVFCLFIYVCWVFFCFLWGGFFNVLLLFICLLLFVVMVLHVFLLLCLCVCVCVCLCACVCACVRELGCQYPFQFCFRPCNYYFYLFKLNKGFSLLYLYSNLFSVL